MPTLSNRGEVMPFSPIRKLVPYYNDAIKKGIKVYSLNIGQPDIPTPKTAFTALKELNRDILEYSPSDGILPLREKFRDYYKNFDINVNVDDIIITTGGSEAVLFAFMACLDPGDEIIVPEPSYANYLAFAISAGVKIVNFPTSIEDNFKLPPIEHLERLITPKTKGILICNPNNPTGYLFSEEELFKLRDVVLKYDLYLFSDEVYREFCYSGAPYFSILNLPDIEDNAVLIDSVSKRYNECGIRIGALVTRNQKLRQNFMKFCQARLSPPLLGQLVALKSFDAPEEYMLATYNEYIERRNILIEELNSIPGVYAPMPMGAFYTMVRLPVSDADHFCQWCLQEFQYEGETVFMAPGSGFYTDSSKGKNEVRIAYVLNKEELRKSMKVLRKALEAYTSNN